MFMITSETDMCPRFYDPTWPDSLFWNYTTWPDPSKLYLRIPLDPLLQFFSIYRSLLMHPISQQITKARICIASIKAIALLCLLGYLHIPAVFKLHFFALLTGGPHPPKVNNSATKLHNGWSMPCQTLSQITLGGNRGSPGESVYNNQPWV